MNQIFLTLAVLASFLIPTNSAEAQIYTHYEYGTHFLVIDGTDGDDTVHVLENSAGTGVYLYNDGVLVDSKYFINFNPIFDFQPEPAISLFGNSQRIQYTILANLKDGNDFYYNNSYRHFAGDIVTTGSGNDTVYASPRESWVLGSYFGGGKKQIYGGDGDDWLSGGFEADTIRGGNGDDVIEGYRGNDILYGDAGDDYIDGGYGYNWIYGGAGNDTLLADEPGRIQQD